MYGNMAPRPWACARPAGRDLTRERIASAEARARKSDPPKYGSRIGPRQQTREFIAALEKVWAQEGYDLSPEAPKEQRIISMKQQADRLDPMLPRTSSMLDRKGELEPHWQYS
jgi:hypothetical protein